MRVLVACEFSGIVREAFKARGHDAISVDLLPSEILGKHIIGDIFNIIEMLKNENWIPRLLVGHPPCTYLCNSGVCWLYTQPDRWGKMYEASDFFYKLWNLPIEMICLENPIPHKYALERIGKKYTQIIQPWMFGHTERKATCLWLKGLPELKQTNNVKEEMLKLPKAQQQRLHYLSPSPNRAHERSRTFKGIAEAMATQWG